MSIIYGKDNEEKEELYIKPDEVKWTLLSISYGSTPKTVIKKLTDLENYIEKEEEIYRNLESINKIKNVKAVKQVIYSRIDSSRTIKIGIQKQEMLAELNTNVDNMYQLFKILNKVQH